MSQENIRKVDAAGLKVGQALTISILIMAFILNSWVLTAFVAIAQLLGAFDAPFAPYRVIYRELLVARGYFTPKVITDNPEPHRFAMLLGGVMNIAATVLLLAGIPVAPWVLVGIVVVLANLNFWLDFCMGCWMYYQFHRLGVPGFKYAPISAESKG